MYPPATAHSSTSSPTTLLLEYGREAGIRISPEELYGAVHELRAGYTPRAFEETLLRRCITFDEWQERLRQRLLVDKILHTVSETVPPPDSREIRAYFDAHRDEFRSPAMVRFRQIVSGSREEAEHLLALLAEGDDMADLARRHSIAPEAEHGGMVDWVARGCLEESMDRVLFALAPGEDGPIVKTSYGFHIFRVEDRTPESTRRFAEVIPEIESRLYEQRRERFIEQWLRDLRSRYPVEARQDLLRTLELS